jgi:hypothetical protein
MSKPTLLTSQKDLNREGWLTELARLIEPLFRPCKLPAYRVTCGWPCIGGTRQHSTRVGECHSEISSLGGYLELFISPLLHRPEEVTGVLCHELAHVAAGVKAAHGSRFIKVCRHVGLTKGKPGQVMPGERLAQRLLRLTTSLGAYPHLGMRLTGGKAKPPKPATSTTLECTGCGCKFRISNKWLSASGFPTCGCGNAMQSSQDTD